MKKIVLAIDSFKGCLTSAEAGHAFALALQDEGIDALPLCVSDGGEGMLDAFCPALHASRAEAHAHDPLMRPLTVEYGIAPDGTAVIESARVCGLGLVAAGERDPLAATSYGLGEVLVDAMRRGCRKYIIGLGGSATSDAGKGMLKALEDSFPDGLPSRPEILLACDVDNPLCGPRGAARIFAPQKGAGPQEVEELERRASRFAEESAEKLGRDCSGKPGAGAAGGLGYAFMQYFGAEMRSGAELLLDLAGFERLIAGAGLVITGEGHADAQTLMGKLPLRVLQRASGAGIPVWLVAGRADDTQALLDAGFSAVEAITPEGTDTAEALRPDTAKKNITLWVRRNIDRLKSRIS